jgi:hypothetical protein
VPLPVLEHVHAGTDRQRLELLRQAHVGASPLRMRNR